MRAEIDLAHVQQTYDKPGISALVATLRMLFDMRPQLKVVISGAVRNADTFESFRDACRRSPFFSDQMKYLAYVPQDATASRSMRSTFSQNHGGSKQHSSTPSLLHSRSSPLLVKDRPNHTAPAMKSKQYSPASNLCSKRAADSQYAHPGESANHTQHLAMRQI